MTEFDDNGESFEAFLDLYALWKEAERYPIEARLQALLRAGGVGFHDEAGAFVSKAAAAIVGIGGLPIRIREHRLHLLEQPVTIDQIRLSIREMMGFCGLITYLNPKDKTPAAMTDTMASLGHFSTAHAASINVLLLGISCAVENEFNCQRDIVHLSRLTVARTRAQDAPPIVVLNPDALPLFQTLRDQTTALLAQSEIKDRECLNNAFPAAKATMVLLTGSLRNFQKLVSAHDDPGKEREFRIALKLLNKRLHIIAPEMFPLPE